MVRRRFGCQYSLSSSFLALMPKNWPGYEIRWAYDSIADLADYVGYDKSNVVVPYNLSNIADEATIRRLLDPIEDVGDRRDLIVSFMTESGQVEIYPGNFQFYSQLCSILYFGSEMVNFRNPDKAYSELICDLGDDNIELYAGVHIDLPRRELHFWRNWEFVDGVLDFERLQASWPGYTIHYYQDQFEIQSSLTNGKLRFEQRDESMLPAQVEVTYEPRRKSFIDRIAGLFVRR